MIDWGQYTIEQDENTKEFVVHSIFGPTYRFVSMELVGDFIRKDLIDGYELNKNESRIKYY